MSVTGQGKGLTSSSSGADSLTAIQNDSQNYETEINRVGGKVDASGMDDTGRFSGIWLGGVQRLTWPDAGDSTVGIDDVLINGDTTSRSMTVGNVDFAAVTESLPAITIVDRAFADDSLDSDWLQKCAGKSWYNETRTPGKYYGVRTGVADAVAAGAVDGDYFYHQTNQRFQDVNSGGTGSTLTLRAGAAEMPLKRLVTAEAGRVIIWDITQGTPTMWKVLGTGSGLALHLGSVASVQMIGHVLVVGSTTQVTWHDFAADMTYIKNAVFSGYRSLPLGEANTSGSLISDGGTPIVNAAVNRVAISFEPDAPVNAAGVRKPLIDAITATGPSQINTDGTVYDGTGGIVTISGDRHPNGMAAYASTSKVYIFNDPLTADTAMASADMILDTAGATEPHISGTIDSVKWAGEALLIATSTGLFRLIYNAATPASSMIAKITDAYATPYIQGDAELVLDGSSLTDRSVNGTVVSDAGTAAFSAVATGSELQSTTATGGALTATVTTGGECYGWEKVGGVWLYREAIADWSGVSEAGGTLTIADGTEFTRLVYVNGAGPSTEQLAYDKAQAEPLFQANSVMKLSVAASVSGVDFDSDSDIASVVNSTGTDLYKGLLNIAQETTTTYADTTIKHLASSGTTNIYTEPAEDVRTQMAKKLTAYKHKEPVTLDFNFVANAKFSTSTGWTLGANWSISGGVATHTAGAASNINQVIEIDSGKTYVSTFTVSGYSAGNVNLSLGGSAGTARSADGTYTESIVAGATDSQIKVVADGAGAFSVDNLSIRESTNSLPLGFKPNKVFAGGLLLEEGTDYEVLTHIVGRHYGISFYIEPATNVQVEGSYA